MKGKGFRGYIFSRPFQGERVPQHVQNLVIRDHANRFDLLFLLSATEYAMPGCFMMLENVVDDIDNLDGIIIYSLFQLPPHPSARRRIYDRVIGRGRTLHAAVEGIVISGPDEIDQAEIIWSIRQLLPHCPSAEDILASFGH